MTPRRVIINADDFGLAPGVNRGILHGFREGVLSSTTMLVNLDFYDDAVALARDNPDLPVGVHLSLLWGRPVSDPDRVPTLVERDGFFPRSLSTLARRYFLGQLDLDQVALEFRNQARKFLGGGMTPTHFDTHKHVHCLPGVFRALTRVARELGVERVRLPYENGALRAAARDTLPRPSWQGAAKRSLVGFLCRGARETLEGAGLRTTDHFIGIDLAASLDGDALDSILGHLPEGSTEVMCHPGYVDEHMTRYSGVPPYRERELAGLVDPRLKDRISQGRIELTHFGAL